MVFSSSEEASLVYDHKLSSVGPGCAIGSNEAHELSGLDLAMKLHYLKGVYFFSSHAVEGITNMKIKETLFYFLNEYFHTCGRFRRSELGRPFLKCNDCGARFIEAHCDKTIDEWFQMENWAAMQKLLVSQQVIGPEISFSPPVLFQATKFRCGGISLGLSWAHILGDPFSASDFMNRWAQVAGVVLSTGPLKTTSTTRPPKPKHETSHNPTPLPARNLPESLKRVDPVGDHWIAKNDTKMEMFSFHISPSLTAHLKSQISSPIFESVSAIVWKSIAKVREELEPKIVTVFKNNPKRTKGVLANSQIISSVQVDFSVMEADAESLASLLGEKAIDETTQIEETVEKDQGTSDFVVYGANLSFVDWQEMDLYSLELQGHKPEFVSYDVQGVGENGVVFVFPGPKCYGESGEGRVVSLILPEKEVCEVKFELKKNGLLLEENIE
ncbi:protein ECERIFERUM 26-like [Humulus lupulus]|uniref:protein ECERIFERUM 26-like n=1 Tax=Humulus lupulus TaxID=3486 RepID=UPI002B40F834|nr:protein ECERIFERUM 26-like [Humulus lupulus]